MILNTAMLFKRAAFLQAAPYERTENRNGHANGFKPRTLGTVLCKLDLRIPQVRCCGESFHTSFLERGSRFDRSLKAAVSEAETHWRTFISSPKARGIGIPDLVTSNAHESWKAALRATINATP